MKRSVLLTILAFSLAMNAATVGSLIFFWVNAQASPLEISVGRKPMKQFLREDLGLASHQLATIMAIIDERRPEIIELKQRFDLTRTEMKANITADPVAPQAVHERVREMNRIQGGIREITINTVMKIAASLPPNAKNRFSEYIRTCGRAPGACGPGSGRGPYGDVKSDR